MAKIYACLTNQYKYKYQKNMFPARFGKQDEDYQILGKIEFYIKLIILRNLTESDIDKIDVRSQLEQQIQNQNWKWSVCWFDKTSSMTIHFHKTTELNGSSFIKIPFRSSAILNKKNQKKYFFRWSMLAHLHAIADSKNGHPMSVTFYRQYLVK